MSNLTKYDSFDSGWASQQLAQLDTKGSGESASFLKLKAGRNVIRVVPRDTPEETFLSYRQHYIKNGDKALSFKCPGPACPACAYANKLRRTGNPADYEAAKEFFAKDRILVNVIDRSEPEKGVQVLGIGKGLYKELLELQADPDTGVNYIHPVRGYDVIITREGTGKFDTKYKAKVMPKASPLGEMEWLEQTYDLSKFAKEVPLEEINAAVNGDGAPFIDVSVPPKRLGAPPARKAPSVADEFGEDSPF